ncbi:hypothetical protein V6N13_090702 [Hibiscus sabdariffa]
MTSTRRLRHNDHGVPHDLIEDILVKLSVKSLVRFNVPKDNKYEMLNSCDGILCFHGRFNIWVHNPATKECRLLPSVFTLDPNPNACWKTMGEVPYKIDVVFSQSAYVNGAIYWFTDEFYHLNQDEVILMFDLHNDKFQAIPHPSSCSNKP